MIMAESYHIMNFVLNISIFKVNNKKTVHMGLAELDQMHEDTKNLIHEYNTSEVDCFEYLILNL